MSWLLPREIKVDPNDSNRYLIELWDQQEGLLVQCGFVVTTDPEAGALNVEPDRTFHDAMANEHILVSTYLLRTIRLLHRTREHLMGPPHSSNGLRGSPS